MITGAGTPQLGAAIPVLGPGVLPRGAGTPQDAGTQRLGAAVRVLGPVMLPPGAGTPGEGGVILVPVRVHKAPQMAANAGRERSLPRGWRWRS